MSTLAAAPALASYRQAAPGMTPVCLAVHWYNPRLTAGCGYGSGTRHTLRFADPKQDHEINATVSCSCLFQLSSRPIHTLAWPPSSGVSCSGRGLTPHCRHDPAVARKPHTRHVATPHASTRARAMPIRNSVFSRSCPCGRWSRRAVASAGCATPSRPRSEVSRHALAAGSHARPAPVLSVWATPRGRTAPYCSTRHTLSPSHSVVLPALLRI